MLFNNIQRGKVQIPKKFSYDVRSLIKQLLRKDPQRRLGYTRDAEEIKEHPFFKDTDWNAYLKKSVEPPISSPIKRIFKFVALERMFGEFEDEIESKNVDGWSFISPH